MLLSYRDRFVPVPCPACGCPDHKQAFEKYSLGYVRCADCGTVYINPRPSPEVLDIYYKNSENYAYWNKYIFPASEDVRREKIFKPRVRRLLEICERHRVSRDTMLEVGAGFGIFCEEVSRAGFFNRVTGIEPTPDLARTCRLKGIDIIEDLVENVDLGDEKISVIASFEVIEHLFSPEDFLRKCFSLLSPGGLLVLTCPNVKGFDISVLGSVSDAVDVEHLNYFHSDSLAALLERCGFEVIETSTPGKLDADRVRQAVLGGRFSLEGRPFLKDVLIERWDELGDKFQKLLSDSGLSSHMWIVAKK
ncbi:MAG: methyltransferase domain-containing protein [Candidatus Omnitrophica bacterium]|nr:methyltransferase domain-containing protein [Candidatus Omnitrophota bacterium]